MKILLAALFLAGCATSPVESPAQKKTSSSPAAVAVVAGQGCGFEGSVQDRIKNCDMAKGDFLLVTKTPKEVIFMDSKSGLFWGPRLAYETNFYEAGKVCQDIQSDFIRWRLPTIGEYHEAHRNGLGSAFVDMHHWFWTSTFRGKKLKRFTPIEIWNGAEGEVGQGLAEEAASVRCVGTKTKS